MSLFVYTPTGSDEPQSWPWEPTKMLSDELMVVEQLTGMEYARWRDAVDRGSIIAVKALLFTYLRRDNKTLKYSDVVFSPSEVHWEMDDTEKRTLLDDLVANAAELDDNERQLLAELRAELGVPEPIEGVHEGGCNELCDGDEHHLIGEPADGGEGPKAPADTPPAEPTTSGTSHTS